ncbi:unnamed protein product, partial [Ectocarpus sp. 13 AM-2016]
PLHHIPPTFVTKDHVPSTLRQAPAPPEAAAGENAGHDGCGEAVCEQAHQHRHRSGSRVPKDRRGARSGADLLYNNDRDGAATCDFQGRAKQDRPARALPAYRPREPVPPARLQQLRADVHSPGARQGLLRGRVPTQLRVDEAHGEEKICTAAAPEATAAAATTTTTTATTTTAAATLTTHIFFALRRE